MSQEWHLSAFFIQLGTGFISRRFEYHVGQVTSEHEAHEKLKSSPTTNLVKSITYSDGRTVEYEYDPEERITKVTDSVDGVTEYTYDALGQLLTETHDGAVVSTMTYDGYGNIQSKNGIAYQYDSVWKDKLTQYGNESITYDAGGNPLSYRGFTFTWEKGRQLQKAVKDGVTYRYTYNATGIRTRKMVGDVEHNYILDGANIIEDRYCGNTLRVLYDNENAVCGIVYNGLPYYFTKNLQGDIIAISDENANIVARYRYDAWGVCTTVEDTSTIGIANINPFRYRGYYLDVETGLYYLQSRYYDPTVGRFINADDVIFLIINGSNFFAYCKNNSIMKKDSTGLCDEEITPPAKASSPIKYYTFSTFWVGLIIDVVLWLVAPGFAATYDGLGLALKAVSSKLGKKYAIDFLNKKVIPTVIYSFLNPIMTLIRAVVYKIAKVVINNLVSSVIGFVIGLMKNAVRLLPIFFSAGSFISGLLDIFTDSKYDGKITIPFKDYKLSDIRI